MTELALDSAPSTPFEAGSDLDRARRGEVLVRVDSVFARRFFTDTPLDTIRERVGVRYPGEDGRRDGDLVATPA